MKRFIFVCLLLLIYRPAVAQETTPEKSMADVIDINRLDFSPEGIEYDPIHQQFLMGALTSNKIFASNELGDTKVFIEDVDLVGSAGIRVDEANKRLLVTNSDFGAFLSGSPDTKALLGIYDLDTTKRLHMVDLQKVTNGGRHYLNDVAVDPVGNAYITDSIAPIVYKVDLEGNASILVEDKQFIGEANFGNGAFPYALNGIVYDPAGYLIVASSANNALFKITLDEKPTVTPIQLDTTIIFPDGLLRNADGDLVVVSGFSQSVFLLKSKDNWKTSTVEGVFKAETNQQIGQTATTAALNNGEVYVLYTTFSPNPPAGALQIAKVMFAQKAE